MSFRRVLAGVFALLVATVLLSVPARPVLAQAAKGAKKAELLQPEDLTLETKDGVALRCTYYPGAAKKASVPVIMVHGWGGTRSEYDSLALGLQGLGHTVIVPDLRGHGQSTVVKLPNGDNETIDPSKLRAKDLEAMVLDLDACKKFLLDKNNAGECNIEMLCVVGAEFGSIVAMQYAVYDWAKPRLPAYKLGQDVKALVLLTPMQSFKGLTTRVPMSSDIIRSKLAMLLVAGREDSKGTAEAKRMHNSFESSRPKVDPEDQRTKLDLFLVQPDTSLTGTKLLGSGLNIPTNIANFIKFRLADKQEELAWMNRENPL
ncbi:MAG TPA: alpha/beta fold hydrolase [Pirellulaceae bacterium]|nr:alpha/beta fold hydrolase [Pirellulaceae bacterium]